MSKFGEAIVQFLVGGSSGTETTVDDGQNALPVRVQMEDSAGSAVPVTTAAPMQVIGPLTDTELRATTVPVLNEFNDSGGTATTVATAAPLPALSEFNDSGGTAVVVATASPLPALAEFNDVSGTATPVTAAKPLPELNFFSDLGGTAVGVSTAAPLPSLSEFQDSSGTAVPVTAANPLPQLNFFREAGETAVGVSTATPLPAGLYDGTNKITLVSHESVVSLPITRAHVEQFHIHLDAESISSSQGFMLIDLSDTTNWPHTNTDHIVLQKVDVVITSGTTFRGGVVFGFLSDVDADNGDFNQILRFPFSQAASSFANNFEFSGGIDLELDEWFGPTTADDTTWQTDVNLDGPDGATSYPSGDGDFVMFINRTAGTIDVSVTVLYETKS